MTSGKVLGRAGLAIRPTLMGFHTPSFRLVTKAKSSGAVQGASHIPISPGGEAGGGLSREGEACGLDLALAATLLFPHPVLLHLELKAAPFPPQGSLVPRGSASPQPLVPFLTEVWPLMCEGAASRNECCAVVISGPWMWLEAGALPANSSWRRLGGEGAWLGRQEASWGRKPG